MFGFIVSAISSAFSAVCSTVASIGGAISNFATTFGPTILNAIKTVGEVFQTIGTILWILRPDEQIEDLGDRALQAADDGIKPENFDKYDDYLQEIRNFSLDPDKSQEYSLEAKQLAGIAVTCKGIEEKFDLKEGTAGALATMTALNPTYFNADRLGTWFQSDMNLNRVVDYFDKKLDSYDSYQAEKDIIKVEKENNPDKTELEIESDIEQTKVDLMKKSDELNRES